MANFRRSMMSMMALLLCAAVGSTAMASARGAGQRNPLAALNRAISRAGAPALTTEQQAQLSALVTTFQEALPDDSGEELEAAREAFNEAILAGDLTAATAQVNTIANLSAELTGAKLQAEAAFLIGVLAVLRSGGQLDPLIAAFGEDRVLAVINGFGHGRR